VLEDLLGMVSSRWFQVSTLGCVLTASRNALMRYWPIVYSWKAPSLYFHFLATVGMMACFGYAFKNADSFFKMWFSSSGLLAIFGWSISAFLFKDQINTYQIAGAAAVVAGTMLMGVK